MKNIFIAMALMMAGSALAEDLQVVTFRLRAPDAKSVSVAGEFNDWNTTSLPMRKSANGEWFAHAKMPPGEYGYKFVVDGQWVFDPSQPARKTVDQTENSRLTVAMEGGGDNQTRQADATPVRQQAPPADWNDPDYRSATALYNSSLAAYQQYLQTRANPASLKTIVANLQSCAAGFEKCRDRAPANYDVQSLIDQCNKVIFDVHGTMQVQP